METRVITRINEVEILASRDNQYVPIIPICQALGIDPEGQRQKIKRDSFLCRYACMINFMLVHKEPVSKKYKAVCTLCWLHTIAIDVVSLVGKERRTAFFTFKFQTTMTKDFEICNAGNNSIYTATFAHETCAVSLSGDPYKDLAAFGFDLHRCQITYRKSPN